MNRISDIDYCGYHMPDMYSPEFAYMTEKTFRIATWMTEAVCVVFLLGLGALVGYVLA